MELEKLKKSNSELLDRITFLENKLFRQSKDSSGHNSTFLKESEEGRDNLTSINNEKVLDTDHFEAGSSVI